MPARSKKQKKITLVFDEKKRREFLGGFRKRKLERKKKAQEELQKQLKEERKRIKQSARERYKKLVSSRDVPELEELLSQHQYETEGHTVSILEVNIGDLAEGNTLIGENKGAQENDSNSEEIEDNLEDSISDDEIKGMSLNESKASSQKILTEKVDYVKDKKDLKRVIKQAALKQVKKSKAFQQKQRLERQKNKKQSMRKLRQKEKHIAKNKRKSRAKPLN